MKIFVEEYWVREFTHLIYNLLHDKQSTTRGDAQHNVIKLKRNAPPL
jgi:hypothetical protein